jgi:hypothetical protein
MRRLPNVGVTILSDDVSDDYSIDYGTECDENYVRPTESDTGCAEDATSDDYCFSEVGYINP